MSCADFEQAVNLRMTNSNVAAACTDFSTVRPQNDALHAGCIFMHKRILSRIATLVNCRVTVSIGALRLYSGRRNKRNENGTNGCTQE